ncbi:MAG: fibrobacter succinogenes major paralogous domain-containing protein [Prevotellaceae bacterium]|jgi:uncharacterized protein (TIGR02145 family)|nr:fibrobacter succinogenes major paralogous domain-containing protein [Prevotellaceae bacterium]
MKQKTFLFAALAAAFLSVANYAAAQVTMGGSVEPTKGAILDLNSTTKGGLLLSNVELTALNDIPASFPNASAISPTEKQALAGMIVWNTNDFLAPNADGLYLWDGNKWNYTGGSDGQALPPPPIPISAPTTCSNPVPDVTFAQYNLGVDTNQFNSGEYATLSPTKRQIRYLADCSPTAAVNVWGDLYQWGRIADGHQKRTSPRYPSNNNTEEDGAVTSFDDNGQPNIALAIGKFIKQSSPSYNWRKPAKSDLWGNGESWTEQDDNQGGVLHTDGKYYQNTDWAIPDNNPCPSGWRIPTQDEWERLVNYDCNPSAGSTEITILNTGKTTTTRGTNNELTWIPVKGGKVTTTNWGETTGNLGGYAVYKASDWTDATTVASGYFYNVDWSTTDKRLHDAAAPEPLLFLPAAGMRNFSDGIFYYRASSYYGGGYWSSTTHSGNSAYGLLADSRYVNAAYLLFYCGKALSVRCVKN